jgi:putative ABC transport system permease protein
MIMNAGDYARAWGSHDASAYNLLLARGTSRSRVLAEIRRALGPNSGLSVQTSGQHAAQQRSLDRDALARLTQISTAIASAAAMGAMVWQRRPRMAKLKLEGLSRAELWQTTMLESLLLLCVGCSSGAIFGLYGRRLADRALSSVIDFPVVHSLAPSTALWSLSLVPAAAIAILAIPGYIAASVPAALGTP